MGLGDKLLLSTAAIFTMYVLVVLMPTVSLWKVTNEAELEVLYARLQADAEDLASRVVVAERQNDLGVPRPSDRHDADFGKLNKGNIENGDGQLLGCAASAGKASPATPQLQTGPSTHLRCARCHAVSPPQHIPIEPGHLSKPWRISGAGK